MSANGVDSPRADGIPYFEAKREMERVVRESGFEFVILRPSFVFGDGGALATFLRLARRSPVTPIIGDGLQRIQPVWIDDVARAVAEALERPEAAGRTLELGGPEIVTWNDFWARLKKVARLRRPSVHVPFSVMRVQATLLESCRIRRSRATSCGCSRRATTSSRARTPRPCSGSSSSRWTSSSAAPPDSGNNSCGINRSRCCPTLIRRPLEVPACP